MSEGPRKQTYTYKRKYVNKKGEEIEYKYEIDKTKYTKFSDKKNNKDFKNAIHREIRNMSENELKFIYKILKAYGSIKSDEMELAKFEDYIDIQYKSS